MLITMKPPIHERCQNAQVKAMNQKGTSVVIATFPMVQGPVMYCRSTARNAVARGSAPAGAGNQNMLEVRARIVSAMPQMLFLYAK